MKKPRILYLDYETSPLIGYFFGNIWETNIIEVIRYEQLLCGAWSWSDEKTVHVIGQIDFPSYKKGKLNDKDVAKFFSNLVNQADYVLAHNGDQFDVKVLNTRLLANHLPPVSSDQTLDTKKWSKNKLHLPSNSLDFIADFLRKHGYDNVPRKLPHTGKNMWFGYEQGIEKDQQMMHKYCKQDVVILKYVGEILAPLQKQTNRNIKLDGVNINCSNPVCGSKNLVKSNLRAVAGGHKRQYQCKDCGKYTTDPKLIKTL